MSTQGRYAAGGGHKFVTFTDRDVGGGRSLFIIVSGGYHCSRFLNHNLNLLFVPAEGSWKSRVPMKQTEIAEHITKLRQACVRLGVDCRRVDDCPPSADSSRANPRAKAVEIHRVTVDGREILALRNSYDIKDGLKSLGFELVGNRTINLDKEWRSPFGLSPLARDDLIGSIRQFCAQARPHPLECIVACSATSALPAATAGRASQAQSERPGGANAGSGSTSPGTPNASPFPRGRSINPAYATAAARASQLYPSPTQSERQGGGIAGNALASPRTPIVSPTPRGRSLSPAYAAAAARAAQLYPSPLTRGQVRHTQESRRTEGDFAPAMSPAASTGHGASSPSGLVAGTRSPKTEPTSTAPPLQQQTPSPQALATKRELLEEQGRGSGASTPTEATQKAALLPEICPLSPRTSFGTGSPTSTGPTPRDRTTKRELMEEQADAGVGEWDNAAATGAGAVAADAETSPGLPPTQTFASQPPPSPMQDRPPVPKLTLQPAPRPADVGRSDSAIVGEDGGSGGSGGGAEARVVVTVSECYNVRHTLRRDLGMTYDVDKKCYFSEPLSEDAAERLAEAIRRACQGEGVPVPDLPSVSRALSEVPAVCGGRRHRLSFSQELGHTHESVLVQRLSSSQGEELTQETSFNQASTSSEATLSQQILGGEGLSPAGTPAPRTHHGDHQGHREPGQSRYMTPPPMPHPGRHTRAHDEDGLSSAGPPRTKRARLGPGRLGSGGGDNGRRSGALRLVCSEPPSWVSMAFSDVPARPRFAPLAHRSTFRNDWEDEEGEQDEEEAEAGVVASTGNGRGKGKGPARTEIERVRWPAVLPAVEVSIGGEGMQAQRSMDCLLAESSPSCANGGPLAGLFAWREETQSWWTTAVGSELWGSRANVTLDQLRASLKTMSALVDGVEFRDLTDGARSAPALRCRRHNCVLVEEAVAGDVISRTRRLVDTCPVDRESCALIPHDGLSDHEFSAGRRGQRSLPAIEADTRGDRIGGRSGSPAAGRIEAVGKDACSDVAMRRNMDVA